MKLFDKIKQNFLITDFIIILVLIIIINQVKTCTNDIFNKNDNKKVYNAVNDSMKTWKDKNNNHSEKQTIVTNNVNDLLEIKSKDVEIRKLQSLVKKYKSELKKGNGITSFGSTTIIDTFYTKPIVKYVDNYVWKDSINNKWIKFNYSVQKDTLDNKVNFSLLLENEYAIINKEKSNGWFKKSTPYTEIINYNPYTKTKNQVSYRVSSEVRNKRISIGPNISYGIGSDFQPQVFIGVGLQYNIIKF